MVTQDSAIAAYGRGEYDQALIFAEIAAENGAPEAMMLAGRLRSDGRASAQNDAIAARWFRLAGETGNPEAWLALAVLGREGRGNVTLAEAVTALEAASNGGLNTARHELALLLLSGGNDLAPAPARARTILSQAATEGDPAAQRDYAVLLLEGQGGPVNVEEAVRWLALAADNGDGEAAYRLGVVLADETGAPYDLSAAASRLKAATAAGHPRAQALYGAMLSGGLGATRDQLTALEHWRKAAEAGDAVAQYYLAIALAKGDGIPRDYRRAYLLLVQSEAGGPLDQLEDEVARARLIGLFEQEIGAETAAQLRAEALSSRERG